MRLLHIIQDISYVGVYFLWWHTCLVCLQCEFIQLYWHVYALTSCVYVCHRYVMMAWVFCWTSSVEVHDSTCFSIWVWVYWCESDPNEYFMHFHLSTCELGSWVLFECLVVYMRDRLRLSMWVAIRKKKNRKSQKEKKIRKKK